MKKLTLEIYVPAAQRAFDVQAPAGAPLSQVRELAGREIGRLSGGVYEADPACVLCDRESGAILNINMTVWELGLRNGSKLMLI